MDNIKALAPETILKSDVGSYRIIRVLGAGGFGITYLAEGKVWVQNITVQAIFAIKEHFISTLCEREAGTGQVTFSEPVAATVCNNRRAFIREANRLHSLGIEHRNIVKINEVFEANNTAYYVMEYLEGVTLQDYVAERGPLSIPQTLTILRPIIDAVATLHSRNTTHYDIKPSNIILVKTDRDTMRPVLIDFGLSKHYDDDGSGTSSLLAQGYTPGYAPMEQYGGLHRFSPQADVYALGATIYYCLMGQKPAPASDFDVDLLPDYLSGKASPEFVELLSNVMAYSKQKRIPNATILYRLFFASNPSSSPKPPPRVIPKTPKRPKTGVSRPSTPPEGAHRSRKWIWLIIVPLLLICGACYFLYQKGLVFFGTYKAHTSDNVDIPAIPEMEDVLARARETYDVVGAFQEDMAIVGRDGRFGFIDRFGREVVKPLYANVEPFSEGMAAVTEDEEEGGKVGFIDKNGNIVIPPKYYYAESFKNGFAVVGYGEHLSDEVDVVNFGAIDMAGREIIQPVYDSVWDYSDGLALTVKNTDQGPIFSYINTYGEIVVGPKRWHDAEPFSEGLAAVSIWQSDRLKTGFIDKNGEFVIQPKYDDAKSFAERLAAVEIDGLWGYIDHNGDIRIKPKYDYAFPFSNGRAIVRKGAKEGMIDTDGNVIVEIKYDRLEDFAYGLALVCKGDRYGFIDTDGNLKINFIYDNAYSFSDGLALVCKDGHYGFIDTQGNMTIENKYDYYTTSFSNGLGRVVQGGRAGWIDKAGKVMWEHEAQR